MPELFQNDLFQLLGKGRPAYRWLIMGPPRSGSTFHKVTWALLGSQSGSDVPPRGLGLISWFVFVGSS